MSTEIRTDAAIRAAREIVILINRENIEGKIGMFITPSPVQVAEIIERFQKGERERAASVANAYGHWLAQENESLEAGRDAFHIATLIRENITPEEAVERLESSKA